MTYPLAVQTLHPPPPLRRRERAHQNRRRRRLCGRRRRLRSRHGRGRTQESAGRKRRRDGFGACDGRDALENDLNSAVAFQKTLGNDTLIIPWISDANYSDSAESWQKLGERFNKIAQQVKAEGMTLLYHNHSFEFGEYDGKLGLEHLLDSAPDLGLELDIGWCQEGSVDPMPLLEKYAGRVRRVHVKDRAPEGENLEQDGWARCGSRRD